MTHGRLTQWNWVVYYPEKLTLGYGVDIGSFTYINAQYGVEIGELTQVGSGCSIYSTCTQTGRHGTVKIGKRCKIGSGTLILPGAEIEDDVEIHAKAIIGYNARIPKDSVILSRMTLNSDFGKKL